jgi:SAM-dependent methyltransferase
MRETSETMLLSAIFKKIFGVRLSKHQPSCCPVCGKIGGSFSPLPKFYHENARRHGYVHFGKGEMTSIETYSCTNCGGSDRERLYAFWIDQQLTKNSFPKNASLIHFAPEHALSTKLKQLDFFDYKTADLGMENVDHKVDMMAMPFEDESFDLFICSHILEHVESDDQAIKELYRITKCGGGGILMAPIIVGLEKTIEDPSVKDEAGRWRLFGQNDHVRLYAHHDYVNKIRRNGFRVEEFGERYFSKEVFRSLGLKRTSILYVVTK